MEGSRLQTTRSKKAIKWDPCLDALQGRKRMWQQKQQREMLVRVRSYLSAEDQKSHSGKGGRSWKSQRGVSQANSSIPGSVGNKLTWNPSTQSSRVSRTTTNVAHALSMLSNKAGVAGNTRLSRKMFTHLLPEPWCFGQFHKSQMRLKTPVFSRQDALFLKCPFCSL